jgi:hypothetical protein
MGVDNLWSQTLLYNKSYLMNFRRWNYNCALLLLSDNGEIYKTATFYIRKNG